MLTAEMIAALRCPLCRQPLNQVPGALRCADGHSFDLAKQGYIFLGTGKALPLGDTAAMVEARLAFLQSGHFAPLLQAVAARAHGNLIVDLGSGPGTYLAYALDHVTQAQGLAFDVSKPALKRAARLSPRLGAVLADTWREIPLRDGAADCVLNVFAPRNGPEMHRILHPTGTLLVVTPDPDHLVELRQELGLLSVDESKPDRLAATLSEFVLVDRETLTWQMDLSAEEATWLVHMGPNAFHAAGAIEGGRRVTASVSVITWKGRPLPSPAAPHDAVR